MVICNILLFLDAIYTLPNASNDNMFLLDG